MKERYGREFVTAAGVVLKLNAVSRRSMDDAKTDVLREFEKAGKPIEPPKYTVDLAGGGIKEYYHDEESIKTATDEEKVAWGEHLACLARLEEEQSERATAVVIVEGIEAEPTEEWLKYMAWRGTELPDNPYDLKVRYVTYELLRTQGDIIGFTTAMLMLTAGQEVDMAAIDAAMESFRDSVRRRTGPILAEFAETFGRGIGTGVDVQPKIPDGESGEESGSEGE